MRMTKTQEAYDEGYQEGRKAVFNDSRYSGWKNYETWNVALWIDNEERSYKYWQQEAQDAYNHAEPNSTFSREENAVHILRERLKAHYEYEKADLLDNAGLSSSMWADLLGSALSGCNWHEIAEHMIDDCDKTTEEE